MPATDSWPNPHRRLHRSGAHGVLAPGRDCGYRAAEATGAQGMLNTSVAPWPSYSDEEQQAVAHVLASGRVNYWTREETREFEREFAQWVGSARAVAVFNGTVALDLALKALG